MYNDRVVKEFANPQNTGALENANGIGTVGSASCGDIMKIYLKIENDVIQDASFQTFGCAAAIASSSVATSMVKGKTINEALSITNRMVLEELGGLPSQKIHCSLLAEEAIKAAVDNYRENIKNSGSPKNG